MLEPLRTRASGMFPRTFQLWSTEVGRYPLKVAVVILWAGVKTE